MDRWEITEQKLAERGWTDYNVYTLWVNNKIVSEAVVFNDDLDQTIQTAREHLHLSSYPKDTEAELYYMTKSGTRKYSKIFISKTT